MALLVSLAIDPGLRARSDGVVTVPESVARSADSVHSEAAFSQPLPSGTELRILDERDDWLRVSLANGREAWVRRASVARVAVARKLATICWLRLMYWHAAHAT